MPRTWNKGPEPVPSDAMKSEAWKFYHRRQDEVALRDITRNRENGWHMPDVPRGTHTIGDLIQAVLEIDNEADMALFYQGAVEDTQDQMTQGKWQGQGTAQDTARSNIGWCYGEGMDPERIAMWRRVTQAEHPVFGANMPSSPAEALRAGIDFANDD